MVKAKASEAVLEKSFVTLLRRHRYAVGLTQMALAKKLKVVPATISNWESGLSIPKAEIIPKLARLLGLDPMELTRIIDPPRDTKLT